MRHFLALGFVALLAGCGITDTGDAFRDTLLEKGAEVTDQTLDNAIAVKCRISSVGAIQRRYMTSPDEWAKWQKECLPSGEIEIPALPQGLTRPPDPG